jgi:hypothetical protein
MFNDWNNKMNQETSFGQKRLVTFFGETLSIRYPILFSSPRNEVSTRWTPYAPPGNPKSVQEDHPMYCLDCPCLMAWVRLNSLIPIWWNPDSQIKHSTCLGVPLFFLPKPSIPHQSFLLPACPTHVLPISRIFQLIATKVKHRLPITYHYTKGHKFCINCQLI